MSGQLFSIGQAVTPKDNKGWQLVSGPLYAGQMPKFGHIYHVTGYDDIFITLSEFSSQVQFDQNRFTPVIDDNVLEKELQEAFTEPVLK